MPSGYSSEGVSMTSIVDSGFSSGISSASHRSTESSVRHEVDATYKLLKKESTHSSARATIAVVRQESFAALDNKLNTPWWKFWKAKAGVFVTTPNWLQRTINHLEDDGRCEQLTLFVSKKIEEIEFDVGASVHALSILRCHHHSRSKSRLLVRGSSTFSGSRVDEWQAKRHRRHALYLGEGVSIAVDMADGTAWTETVPSLPEAQREQVYGHFLCMKQDAPNDGPWWEGWKRHMAIVVGFLSGVGGIAPTFDVTSHGCYVEYRFGATNHLHYTSSSSSTKTPTITTAAGTAGLLKAGVPAPIYFIRWNRLLRWVRGALAVVCAKYWSVLDRLLSWMGGRSTKAFGGAAPPDLEPPRPIRPALSRNGSSQTGKHVQWKSKGTTVSHIYVGDFADDES